MRASTPAPWTLLNVLLINPSLNFTVDFCLVLFSVHNSSDSMKKQLAQREEIQIGNLRNCTNQKQLQGNEMSGIPGYSYLF